LQQASVVGRLFWDQVVAYIHSSQAGEVEEQLVPEALAALRGRELVYRREESTFVDSTEYLFKHDILREVTYESVPADAQSHRALAGMADRSLASGW
jgi:hypothetical protein